MKTLKDRIEDLEEAFDNYKQEQRELNESDSEEDDDEERDEVGSSNVRSSIIESSKK